MSGYIGITIGPIIDTLMLAHSPAAMWYASSMFSSLTEKMCEILLKNSCIILSPYYEEEKKYDDGIGRYHDRIIAKNVESTKIVEKSIEDGKEYIAHMVAGNINKPNDAEIKNFIKQYLQVHWVYLDSMEEDENPIIKIGGILDTLEQMHSPNPNNANNPFFELFTGKEFKNEYVKKRIEEIVENSQLKKGKNLKSIPDITSPLPEEERSRKREFYYTIVQADGDGMGKYIESLKENEMTAFSKACFDYAESAAKLIGNYGGMTVYAGGDDLLFIAPVTGVNNKTVYDLCKEISDDFTKRFSNGPTLSFGVAIRHDGFPLYEALNSALWALEKAKSGRENPDSSGYIEKSGRNTMLVDFQKGSGQAVKIAVPFEKFEYFKAAIDLYNVDENDNQKFKSAIYVLENMKSLFKPAIKKITSSDENAEKYLENVVKNIFDNEGQKIGEAFIKKYCKALCNYVSNNNDVRKMYVMGLKKDYMENNDNSDEYNILKGFEAILRLSKFMIEKKGDK